MITNALNIDAKLESPAGAKQRGVNISQYRLSRLMRNILVAVTGRTERGELFSKLYGLERR